MAAGLIGRSEPDYHPIDFNTRALRPGQIAWLKQRLLVVDQTRGVLLTNNFNPLEHLQIRKAKHYRYTLAGWLGADLLVR
jgi:hypothetical protein